MNPAKIAVDSLIFRTNADFCRRVHFKKHLHTLDQSISLNKFISDTGYCSRREADHLITSGRVLLNDQPAQLGNRYKPGDVVEVDGSIITAAKKEKRVYLALNKPIGITTTTETHIKDNIISFVGHPKRIFPIGRLDKDSEGLIFLTNDGDIINKILRAGNNHEKEYIVRVNKPINSAFVKQMSSGVHILETTTLPCKVEMTGRQTFRITLTQGLNRQIRRMCEALGYAVTGLQRVRIMNVKLDKLAVGKWRYLSDAEVAVIRESVAGSDSEGRAPKKKKPAAKSGKPVFKPRGDEEGKAPAHAPRSGKPSVSGQKPVAAKGADRRDKKHAAGQQPAPPQKGRTPAKPEKKHAAGQNAAPIQKGKAAARPDKKFADGKKPASPQKGNAAGPAKSAGKGTQKPGHKRKGWKW